MKTPMQELIEIIKKRQEDDEAMPFMYNDRIIVLAESMLEKEKEIMKLVHKNGYDISQYGHDCKYGGFEYWDSAPKPFDEFYNAHFKTKEK